MAEIAEIKCPNYNAVRLSFSSVEDVLDTFDSVSTHLTELFARVSIDFNNLFDLSVCKSIAFPAIGANEFDLIDISVRNSYVEFVAAIADHSGRHAVHIVHGWPVLVDR